MKNLFFFLSAIILNGCVSSLDIAKFKQDIALQEIGDPLSISRCGFIQFEYVRQSQKSYEHCGYVENNSGFSIYTLDFEKKYQKKYELSYHEIHCAIHYVNGPGRGVIAFFKDEYMLQIILLEPNVEKWNQNSIDNALVKLKDHKIKVYAAETKAGSPFSHYTFTLRNPC